MKNITFANKLKSLRVDCSYTMKQLEAKTGISQSLLSRYESGKRMITEDHLLVIAQVFEEDFDLLKVLWLSEKVVTYLQDYSGAVDVLKVAEERIRYLTSSNSIDTVISSPAIIGKLECADQLREKWKCNLPTDKLQASKLEEYVKILYTYNSNRIEGNTLSYGETHLVLTEGITISGKSIVEHLEAINHADAIDFIAMLVSGKEDLTKRNLLELHQLVLKGVDTKNAGVFRSVPVMISGSTHVPPQPYLLEKLMEDYFFFYNRNKESLHPIILAAEMSERLVSIHPFIDGNGRVSRLVMNFILLRHGYTTLILKGDQESRLRYFTALEKAQLHDMPELFHNLVLDHAIQSLEDHISQV